jgi:hypothetical protein
MSERTPIVGMFENTGKWPKLRLRAIFYSSNDCRYTIMVQHTMIVRIAVSSTITF